MNIAVLGCGTVGAGVIKLLMQNREAISKRAGEEINVKKYWKKIKINAAV